MSPESRAAMALVPEEAAEVTEALRTLRDAGAGATAHAAARTTLARFLERHLFGVAVWRARMLDGFSARDLFQTAFLSLLGMLSIRASEAGGGDGGERWVPENVEQLRAAFCDLLCKRYLDELRRRVRRPGDLAAGHAGTEDDPAPPEPAAAGEERGRLLRAELRLNALQKALAWLDEKHPELSTAFKARILSNHNLRFSKVGTMSRAVREEVRDENRTFEEVGELLGCSMRKARERYLEAVRVLREAFPTLPEAGKEVL